LKTYANSRQYPGPQDEELLSGVARGDRRALEALYLAYHRRLARFLSRISPRFDTTEEIINDTFMVVWQQAKDFRGASRVSTWIIGIAYRIALKSLRRGDGLPRAQGTTFDRGDRRYHSVSGGHGKDPHVPCARKTAPVATCAGRYRPMIGAYPRIADHRESWDLLPWFVNGRLRECDRQRVDAHVRACGDCQIELMEQRLIRQVMAADSSVAQMPTVGLNKLRQRIDRFDPATSGSSAPPPTGSARRLGRPARVASIIGAAAALACLGAFLWQMPTHGGIGAYYTVTTVTPQRGDAVIRAVFAPALTLTELQGLLDDAHMRIVSGPTEAGVYSLAMTGSQSIEWSLRRLRAHDTVRFAEAVARLPPP
jgi:hypothetical protein